MELVSAGPAPDAVAMAVYERGVGRTEACGTGAVAAAAAAVRWALVPDSVEVDQPGGRVRVDLERPERADQDDVGAFEGAWLAVHVAAVAEISWPYHR